MQILDLTDFNPQGNIIVPFINKSTTEATKISLIAYYAYNIETGNEYFINYKNNDVASTEIKPIFKDSFILNSNLINIEGNYDLELYYWWITEDTIQIDFTEQIKFYQKQFKKIDYRYIPFVLLVDYARNIKNKTIGIIKDLTFDKESFNNFQTRCFTVFNHLSEQQIRLDPEHIKVKTQIGKPYITSNYKLFTSTGRPSNSNKGINLAALNKSDMTREMIIPDEDSILLEFDYSAFHVRLISKLIGYDLPKENPHDYFGKQYFEVDELDEEQYELSKALSFKVVYGGIDDEYAVIPFFKEVYKYRTKLYEEYKTNGFIKSVVYNRPIGLGKKLPEHKLFNYLLQSYETEFNSIIITEIFNYLYNKHSTLILYTYDSFLLNLKQEDGPEVIKDLKKIIFKNDFTGSIKFGKNYGKMKKYND